jgi:hypothetical protein
MRLRTLAAATLTAVVAAAVVVRRRRRTAPPAPAVQFGLDDGTVVRIEAGDPAAAPLRAAASALRAAFEEGR